MIKRPPCNAGTAYIVDKEGGHRHTITLALYSDKAKGGKPQLRIEHKEEK